MGVYETPKTQINCVCSSYVLYAGNPWSTKNAFVHTARIRLIFTYPPAQHNQKKHTPGMCVVKPISFRITLLSPMQLLLSQYPWSNPNKYKTRDGITYPFLNFNGCTVEVWAWINNFILHYIWTNDYLFMLGFTMLVKWIPGGSLWTKHINTTQQKHNKTVWIFNGIYQTEHQESCGANFVVDGRLT